MKETTNEQTNGERFDEFLRTIEGYPELEGTFNLCSDIINKHANESVPLPDKLQDELLSVREMKKLHVKEQRYALASIYREAEKELQSLIINQSQKPEAEEPTCSNCQMLLSAIGVGQGLICDLNKCRIPHSKHTCQCHFKTVPKSATSASFDSQDITDERIYEESAKQGYMMLATQLAWEDGAKWCRNELKK